MAGEAQQLLDRLVIVMRNQWILMCFVILFPIVTIVMLCRNTYLDATTTNVVEIMELNPLLRDHPEIPFLGTDRWNDPDRWKYARLSSVKKAEDWLLEHDYKCRIIPTQNHGLEGGISFKTFAVKGQPGTPTESVVLIAVEYGRGDPHLIPFRHEESESPVDWSRFERIEVPDSYGRADTGTGAGAYFVLDYVSTHNSPPNLLLRISGVGSWPRGLIHGERLKDLQEGKKRYNDKADQQLLRRSNLIDLR